MNQLQLVEQQPRPKPRRANPQHLEHHAREPQIPHHWQAQEFVELDGLATVGVEFRAPERVLARLAVEGIWLRLVFLVGDAPTARQRRQVVPQPEQMFR